VEHERPTSRQQELCWRLREPLRTYERLYYVLAAVLTTCLAALIFTHIPDMPYIAEAYAEALKDPDSVRVAVLSVLVGLLSAFGFCSNDVVAVREAIERGICERRLLAERPLASLILLLAFLALLAWGRWPFNWRPDAPLLLNPLLLLSLSFSATFLAVEAEVRWDRVVLLEIWPKGKPRWLKGRHFLIDILELQGFLASGGGLEALAEALWAGGPREPSRR